MSVSLDRFGRTKDQRWRFAGQTPADRDRYRYGHDYASNRLWRENALTHGTANQFDEAYAHDGLHRLQDAARGTLDDPPSEGLLAKTFEQAWGLDQVGNWPTFKEGDGTNWTLEQTREHNKANEIANQDPIAGTPNWLDPEYDARGNTTKVPVPGDEVNHYYTLTFDAWNRLVKVQDDQGTPATVAEYRYDGANRRIRKYTDKSGDDWTVREFYYNASWQALEVSKDTKARVGGVEPDLAAPAYEQYVWSARYIDAPVLRDRNNDQDPDLEERLYYATDANMNVTALLDTDGTVVERYVYDPYGRARVYSDDWSTQISWANSKQNSMRYCGYYFDNETGLYHVRHRYYHATVGRWISRDPLAEILSNRTLNTLQLSSLHVLLDMSMERLPQNLYEFVRSMPASGYDPLGLACCGPDITFQLLRLKIRLFTKWAQSSWLDRTVVCWSVDSPVGWDILELGQGTARCSACTSEPGCGGTPCHVTVAVGNQCYHAHDVNYIWYGWIKYLCKASVAETRSTISKWVWADTVIVSRITGDPVRPEHEAEAKRWAEEAWLTSFPSYLSVVSASCPVCGKNYRGVLTGVVNTMERMRGMGRGRREGRGGGGFTVQSD